MRLQIESWSEEKGLQPDAHGMLAEAVVCYKAGAYRAALVFSYLCFSATIRHRILKANKPVAFPQAKWDTLAHNLRDEDKRDSAAFDATQCGKPAAIFVATDDLREQVKYWKNRRNDCAHAKDNEVGAPHVEALWLFLQSNLPKFVVDGSAGDLLARIRDHFDVNITAPGTNFDHLIKDIASAVDAKDLPGFCADLRALFSPGGSGLLGQVALLLRPKSSEVEFIAGVYRLAPPHVTNHFDNMVTQHGALHRALLEAHPELVATIPNSAPIVRTLWRKGNAKTLAALVRNAAVPAGEIPEAVAHVAKSPEQQPLDNVDDTVLTGVQFWHAFEQVAFVERKINEFGWGNPNAAFMSWYLETHAISDLAVYALSEVFSGPPNPTKCKDALVDLFAGNATKTAEFKAVAARIGVALPGDITSL